MIKRQMAGRAGTQLLRKRVILVAHYRRNQQPSPDDDLWTINGYENPGDSHTSTVPLLLPGGAREQSMWLV
ncbi:hypothetical protein H9Y04_44355 [Streptomyces sp. TRM66268-LWL]|uniref:Uncharacterized protein n=1 Tax=Streptomyces polyasparticus TaxID=2767826 RepID=A0ABR7SY28_9ACTN|nr:hypothetical protein [Streptomyces polyasparticus]MBC9719547.1 hypothetical protein [Streptomyces polyasparticus]